MEIKDIQGNVVEVTNLTMAIRQCKRNKDSPFMMPSGHTVGEDHSYMLRQLSRIKKAKDKAAGL